jgi:ElaB/YqjD/DUF883 family membrane-anchored ribosome-binding protein
MINPGENDFREDEPVSSTPLNEGENLRQTDESPMGAPHRLNAPESWRDSQENASLARRSTDYFLRENPIPTIIGALAVGLAIGWALRYATARDEKEIEVRSRFGDVNWGFLSLPFLWPLFKSVKEKYEDSAEAVKDRVKNIDVERYTKPIRKRWKAWTK